MDTLSIFIKNASVKTPQDEKIDLNLYIIYMSYK